MKETVKGQGEGNIINFDQQMGNWARVDLKHLPKFMREIEAQLETYARALATTFVPSTKGNIHVALA